MHAIEMAQHQSEFVRTFYWLPLNWAGNLLISGAYYLEDYIIITTYLTLHFRIHLFITKLYYIYFNCSGKERSDS